MHYKLRDFLSCFILVCLLLVSFLNKFFFPVAKELSKDKMRKSAQNSFYGVESVLSNLKSEKTAVNWQGLEASETRAKYLYRSEER